MTLKGNGETKEKMYPQFFTFKKKVTLKSVHPLELKVVKPLNKMLQNLT